MNPARFLTILFFSLALTLSPALPSVAQSTAFAATNHAELLSASSPYGEAKVIKDIPYVPNPAPNQNMDLYLPANVTAQAGSQPVPIVIWIHGGAWMMGYKDWDNVKYLVHHGYAIASVDYRFAPDSKFPAQIQDCNAALNFIRAHGSDYGIDTNRIIVGGGSAGGHLALLLGLARHQADFGADPSFKPVAILDFFGPVDLNRMRDDLSAIHSETGLKLFEDAVPKLLGAPVAGPTMAQTNASPITYVHAGSPPVLILHGTDDDLVPLAQSSRLHDALDAAGVKNQLISLPKTGHDGPHFSTPEMQTNVIEFLNTVLKPAH